jgi:hypothetical protein
MTLKARRRLALALFCLLSVSSSPAPGQQQHYFFYKPAQTRGSDATFSPLTLLLNGSFDAMRIDFDAGHNLTSYKWKIDAQNVWNNITNPVASVRAYGWDLFRRQELFNLSFNVNNLQFIPNITDHVIGYGMQYAKVTEWYDSHGYPEPVLWGIGTSLVYQYVNEMVQNAGMIYTNVDCVADYDIFNVLGYVFFSCDGVKQFFSETVQLNDWSLQPLYVPRNYHIENVGQEFVLRYRLRFAERYAPFVCWGVNSVFGLSYRYDNENSVSFGIGQTVAGMIQDYRDVYISTTPKLETALGVYWDNNGSLLAGLVLSGKTALNAQLNIYPGVVEFGGIHPGCYVGMGKKEGLVLGVTFKGIPVSLGIER